jgi:hypothetical protein
MHKKYIHLYFVVLASLTDSFFKWITNKLSFNSFILRMNKTKGGGGLFCSLSFETTHHHEQSQTGVNLSINKIYWLNDLSTCSNSRQWWRSKKRETSQKGGTKKVKSQKLKLIRESKSCQLTHTHTHKSQKSKSQVTYKWGTHSMISRRAPQNTQIRGTSLQKASTNYTLSASKGHSIALASNMMLQSVMCRIRTNFKCSVCHVFF